MGITRTHWIDDDGTGTSGTVINDAEKQLLYDQIDAAIAAASGGGVTLPIDLTTQVTGTLQAAQEPAHTGDVTNAVGSLALAIGAGKVTNAMLAGGIDLATKVIGTLQAAQEPAHTGDVINAAGSLALAIGVGKVVGAMIAAATITADKINWTQGVALTDGANVDVIVNDRAAYYRLAASGDRTLNAPTNPIDGQKIIIAHTAAGGANRTLTLTTGSFGFRFGSDITALTPTVSGKTDYIGAIYNQPASRWDVVAYTKGF